MSLQGCERGRETSLPSLRASCSVPAALRLVLPACDLYSTKRWPGRAASRDKDRMQDKKAGRGPQPPTAGVMEDSVKPRATPAALGKGRDGKGDNTAANWGGGKE